MDRVLIVDDDRGLSELLAEYLRSEGLEVDCANDGVSGLARALADKPDIVVLDVMMPGMDGVSVLRQLRARSDLPVLMLTAKGDDIDRIVGLELGADDYVPKPCTPRELLARIRAILRRHRVVESSRDQTEPLVSGPFTIWRSQRRASFADTPLTLTGAEFGILERLVAEPGRVIAKAELSEKGLGRPLARYDRSVDVHISSIRQKLSPRADGSSWIQTVRGQGYLLVTG
ncbi:MAG: response regulator transcription factor [Burkholderiaceae bacterium]